MGVKTGLMFLLVLGISFLNNVDARNLDILAKQVNYKSDTEASQADGKSDGLCSFCEDYATQAVEYLSNNETQIKILDSLHLSCSYTHGFKKECLKMVDYYVPLFFLEIESVEPEKLCHEMNLCDMVFTSEDKCTVCHGAVAEILEKLEDPDTQLEIIEILLKACAKTEQYAKKCKRLVFEYGPLIMANAEKFLVKNDLCTVIGACNATSTTTNSLFADS
ncbi:hypothetical protein ACHQM5_013476 [Ranunculus cassubicifolius]